MEKKYEEIHFVDSTKSVWNYSLFGEEDITNFQAGTLYRAYELFGAHEREVLGQPGYYFAVWAPNATYISVIGNFNNWDLMRTRCMCGSTIQEYGRDLFRA